MENALVFNITCDCFNILISLILTVSLLFDQSGNNKLRNLFSRMLIINVLMAICDIPEWIPASLLPAGLYRPFLLTATTLYFAFFFMLMASFFFYECQYVDSSVTISRKARLAMILFTVVSCILLTVTVPFKLPFYMNDADEYVRGVLYPVMVLFYFIQDVFCFYVPIRSFGHMRVKEMVFIFVYALIPFVALVFQSLFHGYALETTATTMALLLAYINVQTELTFKNQQEQSEKLTHVLVESIEAKDQYTKGHSARVAKYAREIGYRLGYNHEQLRELYLIALLHDVGKMGIPDAIINKNGRLDDAEIRVIRRHPSIGANILREFPDFVEGALYHHERYDGKGYPEGIAGHRIPEKARIIAVADSYDAMTSNRSYRNVMPQQDVRREIIRGMGTQFDPKIADIMVDIIDEDKDYRNRQQMQEVPEQYL